MDIENYINGMSKKFEKYLDLINNGLYPFGIEIKYENDGLVPYYGGSALQHISRRSYVLPDIAMTEGITIKCNTLDLLIMRRKIWADKYELGIDDGNSDSKQGIIPLLYLKHNGMISCSRFKVNVSHDGNDDDLKDYLITVLFAGRLAILVSKDKVKVGQNVNRWWSHERGEFAEIPYSGYDDLYNILETAIDGLVNNEWTNPNKVDADKDQERGLYLRVMKRFLITEVNRAIDYLKQKDIEENKGQQLVKKPNETD